MAKTITRVNYNFTDEQQELYSQYFAYVKENNKSLLDDPIMREKTKNMLAYAVIQPDHDLPDLPDDFKYEPTDFENLIIKEDENSIVS